MQQSEQQKLQSQLDNCTSGPTCLACDAIRDRLRLLEAPALDLDALPVTVPPEHQASTFGRLWPPSVHSDRAIRRRLSVARDAGLLGAVEKRGAR